MRHLLLLLLYTAIQEPSRDVRQDAKKSQCYIVLFLHVVISPDRDWLNTTATDFYQPASQQTTLTILTATFKAKSSTLLDLVDRAVGHEA